MPEIKKANAGTSAGNNSSHKDIIISVQTALTIRNWINTNYQTFTDSELIERFNMELSDLWNIYRGNFTVNYPKFSYYKAPVKNTIPIKEIDLLQLYHAIIGTYYKNITETFRAMEPGEAKGEFKKNRFDHCINLKHKITWTQLTICR